MGTVGEALFLYSPVYPVARRSCCVAYDFDLTEGRHYEVSGLYQTGRRHLEDGSRSDHRKTEKK